MGNVLCFHKKRKESDGSSKKERKRTWKRNRRINYPQNDGKGQTCDLGGSHPLDDNSDKIEPKTNDPQSTIIYVCPVVSSSILLRHEDEDDDNELSKDQDQKELVDQTQQSVAIETRSTAADDITSDKEIENEKRVVANKERSTEEIAPTTQAIARQEEPVATTVRVINVQEVNDNIGYEPSHQGNNEEKHAEELFEFTHENIKHEERHADIKSIEFKEANKSSEPRAHQQSPSELYVDKQSGIKKRTDTETREELKCPKPVKGEISESHMNNVTTDHINFNQDEEHLKQSRLSEDEAAVPSTTDSVDTNTRYEGKMSAQTKGNYALDGVEKIDNQAINESKYVKDTCSPDLQKNVTHVCVKSVEQMSGRPQEVIIEKSNLSQDTNISAPMQAKTAKEIKSDAEIPVVETPSRENNIKEAVSCPMVPEKKHVSSHIKEFGALLNVLSELQIPASKTNSDPVVPASSIKRHVFGPQSESSDKPGVYKSAQGIENWVKQSNPGASTSSRNDSNTSKTAKKVSDFIVPWKPRKLPPKPLPLKKPSSHLHKIPDVARSASDDDTVNWTQLEPKGPQTEVLWTTKPSAFDVKLPPLPKRLLERKGSVEKLQESWILPQVKQIETLKREYGRFPGLVVPPTLRQHYSVDIKTTIEADHGEEERVPETDVNNNDEGRNVETDTAQKGHDN